MFYSNKRIISTRNDWETTATGNLTLLDANHLSGKNVAKAKGRKRGKILMILSSKSSGSSALQVYLTKNFNAHYIPHSDHFEHESLYWTKVASVLDLPQERMHKSEVPIAIPNAVDGLSDLMMKNDVGARVHPQTTKEDFFEFFFQLCQNTSFPVVEKSPHHLFNFSNVELILEFKKYIADRADVILIGLVRHPIDTVYSGWTRWRFNCAAFEKEWLSSYQNLYSLVERGDVAGVFRYEDLSRSSYVLDEFLTGVCGLKKTSSDYSFNEKSLNKWKRDGLFPYKISEEAKDLARDFGYGEESFVSERRPSLYWTAREVVHGWWVLWKQRKG